MTTHKHQAEAYLSEREHKAMKRRSAMYRKSISSYLRELILRDIESSKKMGAETDRLLKSHNKFLREKNQ